MKYHDEFSKTGFLPNRTLLWNISISADSVEGALKALKKIQKAIKNGRVSLQIVEADFWLELDKLKIPNPEWLDHLQVNNLSVKNQNEKQP